MIASSVSYDLFGSRWPANFWVQHARTACLRTCAVCGGLALALGMWTLNLHEAAQGGRRAHRCSILPLAAVHTLGNLLTNVSLGQVAVSFTHTIKVLRSCPFQLPAWCALRNQSMAPRSMMLIL